MAANRFTKRGVYSDFQPLSMEEMMMPVQAAQQNHNNVMTMGDSLGASLKDTKKLAVHNDIVKQEVDQISSGIDDITTRITEEGYSPELFREIKQLKRRRDDSFASTGLIGKAGAAYTGYQANVKAIDSIAKMDPKDRDLAKQFAYKRYAENKGGLDQEGMPSEYKSFSGTNSINYQKSAVDYASEIKAQTTQQFGETYEDPQGNLRSVSTKDVVLGARDIQKRVVQALKNDPEITNYMDFLTETNGYTEEDVNILLGNAAGAAGNLKAQNDHYDMLGGKGSGGVKNTVDNTPTSELITSAGGKYTMLSGTLGDRQKEIDEVTTTDPVKGRRLSEELKMQSDTYDNEGGKRLKNDLTDKIEHVTTALKKSNVPPSLQGLSEEEIIKDIYELGTFNAFVNGDGLISSYNGTSTEPYKLGEKGYDLFTLYNSPGFAEVKKDIMRNIPNVEDRLSLRSNGAEKHGKYIESPNMLETAQKAYNDGLDGYLKDEVQDFKEQKTEIRPSHGNFKDITENLKAALSSEQENGFIFVKEGGEDVTTKRNLELKKEFVNEGVSNITPVMFIDGGSFRNPRIKVKVKYDDGETKMVIVQMNGDATSGTGESYSDAILSTFDYVKNAESGKLEKVTNGKAVAQNFKDDIAYQGLLASRDKDFDMSDELVNDRRFGVDKVNNIKGKLGGSKESTLNVYQEGQGYKIKIGNKRVTWQDLMKIGMPLPKDGKETDEITIMNPGSAFQFLDAIGQ
jgi:hypothetical protein